VSSPTSGPAAAESVRAQQWRLDAVHAPALRNPSTGNGVTIAVIDSGVEGTLADLESHVLREQGYSSQLGDEHSEGDASPALWISSRIAAAALLGTAVAALAVLCARRKRLAVRGADRSAEPAGRSAAVRTSSAALALPALRTASRARTRNVNGRDPSPAAPALGSVPANVPGTVH
jgi:subtilisin family serine protease